MLSGVIENEEVSGNLLLPFAVPSPCFVFLCLVNSLGGSENYVDHELPLLGKVMPKHICHKNVLNSSELGEVGR